jgi:hypothetical protein
MSDTLKFVPYGKVTPFALLQQMTARLEEARDAGRQAHFVGCIAVSRPEGGYLYHSYWSSQPPEVILMSGHELLRASLGGARSAE